MIDAKGAEWANFFKISKQAQLRLSGPLCVPGRGSTVTGVPGVTPCRWETLCRLDLDGARQGQGRRRPQVSAIALWLVPCVPWLLLLVSVSKRNCACLVTTI